MKGVSVILGGNLVLLSGAAVLGRPGLMLSAIAEGFLHIIPQGPDHVAFLLGLFFLARSFHALLWQVTFFTIAHSLTFGLAVIGLVTLPSSFVEVAVALSIAFVAAENLFVSGLEKWRPVLIFLFGLIHGLAFAHTLQSMPTEADEWLPRLFGFNLGIELGQLLVVGGAALVARVWWKREWYRARVAVPASLIIGAAGLAWAFERLWIAARHG